MTEQEAIKNVTAYVYMECENMPQQVIKALDIMKICTEKQIEKKVLIKQNEKTPWTREISQYLCPCCDRVIGFNGQIHCSTCGQKLLYDWGNEDERSY